MTIYEDERVGYEAGFRAAAALAYHLAEQGVRKGDRVAIAMRNLPEWPVAFFAATALGAVVVPLNAWWTGAELAYGLADAGSRVLITDDERHSRLALHYAALPELDHVLVARSAMPLQPPAIRLEDVIGTSHSWAALPDQLFPEATLDPDDDAFLFYTSGTTGLPKGAVGSHRNMLSNVLSSGYSSARAALRRGETPPEPAPKVLLTVIPLFHVTACSAGLMGAIATGSTSVYMRRWNTVRAMEIIARERVAATGGVPTIAWELLNHPHRDRYDLSSLESISYGGAPSPPELVRRIHATFGVLPGTGWGMTETCATVTNVSGEDYLARPTSAGLAVATADLKIVAEDGVTELPTGEVGELWARGPMIVRGYWNKPEATASTFVDGWVRTGDMARLDADGFLYVVDRVKDMVIRGGENIYSTEVENVLYTHPAVIDCALIGIDHQTLGEEPAAIVHLAAGAHTSVAELRDWVGERLAAFKVPVAIRFVDCALPRNAAGKILKKGLKTLFEDTA